MSVVKKTNKSKFSDLLNESQFEKSIPKKKAQKRQIPETLEDEEDVSKLIGMYQASTKKKMNTKRCEANFNAKESRQKLLNLMEQQMEARKGVSDNFIKSLLDVITQLEADYEALAENEQKLEHLATVFVKCIKQTSSAQKQDLKALKDIYAMFKKENEQIESVSRAEAGKLADELEEDMNKLQQQLVAETKRKQFENLRRTIFHAIQNDL